MSDEAAKLLQEALAAGVFSVIFTGEARELIRSCAAAAGETGHLIAFAADTGGWRRAPGGS